MIKLSNNHEFEFCAASGALGLDGNGYWWEQPLRWLKIIKPEALTIITKTLTLKPIKGNLDMWHPWRCVQLIRGGVINAVGFSNPGIKTWLHKYWPIAKHKKYNIIVSVYFREVTDAIMLAKILNSLPEIKGIEINLSCPNIHNTRWIPEEPIKAFKNTTRHPIVIKLGHLNLKTNISRFEKYAEAFDLINSIHWPELHKTKSPLDKYGLIGSISGLDIRDYAVEALKLAKKITNKPIISGGGVYNLKEVLYRRELNADAISFGTIFLKYPWRPNRIIKSCTRLHKK